MTGMPATGGFHECSFPVQPPDGTILTPGPCGCGITYPQNQADQAFDAACELAAAAWPLPEGEYLTGGADEHGWHAVARAVAEWYAPRYGRHLTRAVCGRLIGRADKYGPWNPVTFSDPCPDCTWTVAAATDRLDEANERLVPPNKDRDTLAKLIPNPVIAAEAAAMIIDAASAQNGELGPADIQLLAVISRHRPVLLYSEECAEGFCDGEHGDGPGCPASVACKPCSQQLGAWAGEWEGTFRSEVTIPAPCAVLTALHVHAQKVHATKDER